MAEYIEREKAKELFYNGHTIQSLCERGANTLGEAFSIILDEVPAADVRPVVRGKWNNIIQGIIPSGQCSNCKAWDKVTRFCPNCGADMRGEQDV